MVVYLPDILLDIKLPTNPTPACGLLTYTGNKPSHPQVQLDNFRDFKMLIRQLVKISPFAEEYPTKVNIYSKSGIYLIKTDLSLINFK